MYYCYVKHGLSHLTLDLVKLKSYKSYHMIRKDRIGGGVLAY